jgi:GDP-D-mannose dehydratase
MLTAQAIAWAVDQITRGIQNRFFVPDLDAVMDGDPIMTIREFIRQTFLDLGVEVEFSGKGPHEKGVVIDLDSEKMQQLNLDPDTLRFGQTVVKAGTA